MEKYMYIFRGGDNGLDTASPQQMQANMQKWNEWMKTLAEKGNLAGGEPLEKEGRQVNGKQKLVTDGPFMEAKEAVGGYLIVKANSLDEATALSKGCPIFENDGKLEIRKIVTMDMPAN